MAIPRARTDLARLGAWSAAIGHAPRVLGGAAVTNRRAQLIKEIFWMGVTLTPASQTQPNPAKPSQTPQPNRAKPSHTQPHPATSGHTQLRGLVDLGPGEVIALDYV